MMVSTRRIRELAGEADDSIPNEVAADDASADCAAERLVDQASPAAPVVEQRQADDEVTQGHGCRRFVTDACVLDRDLGVEPGETGPPISEQADLPDPARHCPCWS